MYEIEENDMGRQIDIEGVIAAVAASRGPALPKADLDALVAQHAENRIQRRREIDERIAARPAIPAGLAEAILRSKSNPVATVRTMNDVARRAYNRAKQSESRAKRKAMLEDGRTPITPSTVRDGLADAAISLIRAGGPAADAVLAQLARAFAHAPGVPMTVRSDVVAGRLTAKLPR